MLSLATERTVCYLKNLDPVNLLFEDEGDLAKHPLSCHPQGVFGRKESARKVEKISENPQGRRAKSFGANFID